MRRILPPTLVLLSAAAFTTGAGAQLPRRPAGAGFAYIVADPDRAVLGVTTQSSGKRDTLGVLVAAVTAGGPADKAGIEEGNRIASINGVNLKLSHDDADEPDMAGAMTNRLSREMRKLKAGDEASLEVWANGRYKTVKVKTATANDLEWWKVAGGNAEDRAALGLSLSSTGSKRDTLGVFVASIAEDGPADKAGIAEGDRVARINGVDLRTPREDIGDGGAGGNRIERLTREIRKLKAGDAATLTVISGGRSRDVKVTAVRAGDLKNWGGGGMFHFGPGDGRTMVMPPMPPMTPDGAMAPRARIYRDDGGTEMNFEGMGQGLRDSIDESLRDIGPKIRMELDRELPQAMDKIRESMERMRIEMPEKFKTAMLRGVTI